MNTKITFVELVGLLSEATSTTDRVCEVFLLELFSTISQSLIKGRPVKVKGIGEFSVVETVSRKSADDTALKTKAHKRITFTPDKALAEALNEPFAQFKTITLDDTVTDEQLAEIDAQFPTAVTTPIGEDEQPQPPVQTTPAVESTVKPIQEPTSRPEPVAEPAPRVEPQPHISPAMAKSVEHNPVERKPMLVGIPIDGPSQPVPEPEPVEEDMAQKRFFRPELRNTYTPTPEQIEEANRKPDRRWWWPALGVLLAGALMWWWMAGSHDETSITGEQHIAMAADTISDSDTAGLAEAKPIGERSVEKAVKEELAKKDAQEKQAEEAVKDQLAKKTAAPEQKPATSKGTVTDVVTSQIVLTTLAQKHYGSQWFWVYIYEENKNIISNPNNIRPGTRVVIPPAEKYGINVNDPKSLKKAQRRSWELLR